LAASENKIIKKGGQDKAKSKTETWAKLRSYFELRFQWQPIVDFAKKKTVPEHPYSFWTYFGGICLFLFIIQVITGLLLLLYYVPAVDKAHESIVAIMGQVRFGWLIRSVHSWSANILIGAIFIHMFSTFLLKAYRPPREITWISGFFLLLIFLAFGFSGYLLPWNELSFFATRVGTDIIGQIPIIGQSLKFFVLGGPEVSGSTLSRFYWFHIAILPLLALLFLGVHLYLIQVQGISRPIGIKPEQTEEVPFFPDFILRDAAIWFTVLAIIGVLCVFFPWEVGEKADPFAPTPIGIRPEWYFTFMFTTLKLVPAHILSLEGEKLALLVFALGGLLWMLVPFWDKRAQRDEKNPLTTAVGVVVLVYIFSLTLITYLFPRL
jgi:cytochrome b6